MYNLTQVNTLTSRAGTPLPLRDMAVEVLLHDSLAHIEQRQEWHNTETLSIEALYCFPLPVQATLLGVEVTLDERVITAQVAECGAAEQAYEQAMVEGDSALLLEQVEPGLYNLSLGNLLPGDRAVIRIRYALPLQWMGRQLRLALPTTVAPRYSKASVITLQPQHIPHSDPAIEHRYRLEMRVTGSLAAADISSPSHAISQSRTAAETRITFADNTAAADRDLVISLINAHAPCATANLALAGSTTLLHAVFPIPPVEKPQALALKVLVDCSGSMAGDSMGLARKAAVRALTRLDSGDSYALAAFGSHVEQAPGNQTGLQAITSQGCDRDTLRFAHKLDARLGGTDMIQALEHVFALHPAEGGNPAADVLLITDGETWQRDDIVRLCRDSRHRIFVIGCGACPAESVVREIAEATGGAADFVAPGEDLIAVVDRHMQRMRQPRISKASLKVPGQLWQSPEDLTRCTFADSTLHIFSALQAPVSGPVELTVAFADNSTERLSAAVNRAPEQLAGDLLRIANATRIRETLFNQEKPDEAFLLALALEHQLISPYTHYLMVEKRDDNAGADAPELRQVPGMLAAGWGGTGATHTGYLDMPTFMRKGIDHVTEDKSWQEGFYTDLSPRALITHCNTGFNWFNRKPQPAMTLQRLLDHNSACGQCLEAAVADALCLLVEHNWPEQDVVLAFWYALLNHPRLKGLFNRGHRRAIVRTVQQKAVHPDLLVWLRHGLRDCSADHWQWDATMTVPEPAVEAAHSAQ